METGSAVIRGNSISRRVHHPQIRRIKAGVSSRMNTSLDLNVHVRNQRSASATSRKHKTLKGNLLNEYGNDIQKHLKMMEGQVDQGLFLKSHQISMDYRAKMVDWMVEVLTTFKNSD